MTLPGRLVGIATLVYLPHLTEEALTGMANDPIIVFVSRWLAQISVLARLGEREAAYLAFQVTFAVALVAAWLFARGGRSQVFVLVALGLALVAEAHHPIRALALQRIGPGLTTSLPMPFAGIFVIGEALRYGTSLARGGLRQVLTGASPVDAP
jgi:hypothetical protein